MENKDNYTPQEVADMVGAYAQLAASDLKIGGGKRIQMPGIEEFGKEMSKMANVIPQNVADKLMKKPSELEKSILATVERSKD